MDGHCRRVNHTGGNGPLPSGAVLPRGLDWRDGFGPDSRPGVPDGPGKALDGLGIESPRRIAIVARHIILATAALTTPKYP